AFFYTGRIIFYLSNSIPKKHFSIHINSKEINQNKFKMITSLITATLSTFLWIHFEYSLELLCYLIILWSFTLLFLIDLKYFLLPDIITLPLIWIGLIINTQAIFALPENAILGAVLGYGSLFTISKFFRYLRGKEGLGMGDCKLF